MREFGTPPPLTPLWTGDDDWIQSNSQERVDIISEWPEAEGPHEPSDVPADDDDDSGVGRGGDPASSGASSLFGGSMWTDDGPGSASACDDDETNDDDTLRATSSVPMVGDSGDSLDLLTGARWESRWPPNVYGVVPAAGATTMPVWPQSVSPTVWRVLSGHDLASLEEYVSPFPFAAPTTPFQPALSSAAAGAVLLLDELSRGTLFAARSAFDAPLQMPPGRLAKMTMVSAVGPPVRALREVAVYVCPTPSCPKSFTRRHDLKRHLRVHAKHRHVSGLDHDGSAETLVADADALATAAVDALLFGDGIASAYDVDSLLQADAAVGSGGSGSRVTQSTGVVQVAAVLSHLRPMQAKASFTCTVPWCGHTFTTRAGLVRHAHTHTGERLHRCGICGQLFGRIDNCRKHELGHASELQTLQDTMLAEDDEMRTDDSI